MLGFAAQLRKRVLSCDKLNASGFNIRSPFIVVYANVYGVYTSTLYGGGG